MIAFGQIALTYVGILLALRWTPRAASSVRNAGVRSAWLASFLLSACVAIGTESVLRALPSALAVGVWMVVISVAQRRSAWLGVGALVLEACVRGQWLEAIAIAVSVTVSSALVSVIVQRKRLFLRTLAYWLSFAGTFAWLIPWTIAERTSVESSAPHRALCVLLASAGVLIATLATHAFYRAGGTPEPLDAPSMLVTNGVYAHVRHPIALAEMLMVAAGLAWFPQVWVAVYAVAFGVVLVGPARIREEKNLEARFGDDYRAWRDRNSLVLARLKRFAARFGVLA